MTEHTNSIQLDLKAPGFGNVPVPFVGHGTDDAVFSKIALPLDHGISVGILLSHETSHFDATSVAAPSQGIRYSTAWRPSGGLGVAWQPSKTLLFGIRALLNNDQETRTDPAGTSEGLARSYEFRLGGSLVPWEGGLIDLGGTRLEKRNSIAGTHTITYEPNVGFEQAFARRHLTLRVGVDETSPTAGATIRVPPLNVDIAYVRNMARARVGELFDDQSNSVLVTFTVDYEALWKGR
jgi:hypothetical protein